MPVMQNAKPSRDINNSQTKADVENTRCRESAFKTKDGNSFNNCLKQTCNQVDTDDKKAIDVEQLNLICKETIKKEVKILVGDKIPDDLLEELIEDLLNELLKEISLTDVLVDNEDAKNNEEISEVKALLFKLIQDKGLTEEKNFKSQKKQSNQLINQTIARLIANKISTSNEGKKADVELKVKKDDAKTQLPRNIKNNNRENRTESRENSQIRFPSSVKNVSSEKQVQKKESNTRKVIDMESRRLGLTQSDTRASSSDVRGAVINEEITNTLNNNNTRLVNSDSNRMFFMNGTTNNAPAAREVIQQIVQNAQLMVNQNSSEMQIQLKPEFLGKMFIRISVEEGIVTARFVTESHNVKQLLEANMNTLRQTLEANGLRVERTEVNVGINNNGNNSPDQEEAQQLLQWQQQESKQNQGFLQLQDDEIEDVEEELIDVIFDHEEDLDYDIRSSDEFLVNKQVNFVV
ncbi:flagellar hook-length control protein FliK [Candidatus Syntrophocurvum alkaliphilum]|uniref:flagellar hook-length control protein FliK n=1 Tax=Candidatus Syntrophocurvum alkaliphilum TaxID=2293317 RepID=UPI001FAAAA33|nr:flagellar hook-length control protein FliK [Candidatus Syntrophocurvum alkaliphilum]